MVNIPFVNIDVAEPRIVWLLPTAIEAIIQCCARLVDAVNDAIHPLNSEEEAVLLQAHVDSLPREFHRIFKKVADGRNLNDEQLSSECEDAAYDYYRRMLRTNIIGASEDFEQGGPDLFMAKQLGLDPRLHPNPAVLEANLAAARGATVDDVADALGIPSTSDGGQAARAALSDAWSTAREQALVARLQAQAARVAELKGRVARRRAHSARTVANAGLGVGLGLLVLKGLGVGLQRAIRYMRKQRKAAAKEGERGGFRRQPSPRGPLPSAGEGAPQAAAAGPSAAGRGAASGAGRGAGAAAATAAAGSRQQAAGGSRGQGAQQQQQQHQGGQQPAATRARRGVR